MPRQPNPWSWRGWLSYYMPYIEAVLVLSTAVGLVKLLWEML